MYWIWFGGPGRRPGPVPVPVSPRPAAPGDGPSIGLAPAWCSGILEGQEFRIGISGNRPGRIRRSGGIGRSCRTGTRGSGPARPKRPPCAISCHFRRRRRLRHPGHRHHIDCPAFYICSVFVNLAGGRASAEASTGPAAKAETVQPGTGWHGNACRLTRASSPPRIGTGQATPADLSEPERSG